MAEEYVATQEAITIKFDGGSADRHEIEATVLANSILAFAQLTEHANKFLNGHKTVVSTKVKGTFKEGSVEVNILVDYLGATIPLVSNIVHSISQLIEFKQFLNGDPPKNVEQTKQQVIVENTQGNTTVISPNIYIMNTRGDINLDLGKVMQPLEHGIGSVAFIDSNGETASLVAADQKNLFVAPPSPDPAQSTKECQLEILTPNIDGKPEGWRFYDPEHSVEFKATVMDQQFLEDIKNKSYSFQSGDLITVILTEVKKIVNQRKRIDRIINQVLQHQHTIIE